MKKIRCLLVVLLAMSIQFARGADLPTVIDRPITGDGPTQVSVGIWIADITSIDSAQQSFTAEIAVVLRWKDPRLAHTGNGVVRYPLEQVWRSEEHTSELQSRFDLVCRLLLEKKNAIRVSHR